MTSLISRLPPFSYLRRGFKDPLDDLVDRLSSPCSVFVFAFLLTAHVGGLVFGDHFSCAYPAQYTSSWISFSRAFCYVNQFVYVGEDDGAQEKTISYFPWVSMVLFAQAFGFFAPRVFWHFAARHSDLDYLSIIHFTRDLRKNSGEELHGNIKRLTNFIARHMNSSKHESFFFLLRSPIVLLYLFKKWLYVFNAVLQFCLIILFVGGDDWGWGVNTFIYAFSYGFGQSYYSHEHNQTRLPTSPNFPTFAYCKVPFEVDGNKEHDHVSCILTMNYLTEKIYIIAYFWILIVAFSALLSALYNTAYYVYPGYRINFVMSRIEKHRQGAAKWRVKAFVNNFLHADGLLAINLIENSCDRRLSEMLLCELWDKWSQNHNFRNPTYKRFGQPLDNGDKLPAEYAPNSPLI